MVASHYYLWLEPGGAFLVMRMRLFQSSIDGKLALGLKTSLPEPESSSCPL